MSTQITLAALSEQLAILSTIGRIISVIGYGVPKFRIAVVSCLFKWRYTIMQLIFQPFPVKLFYAVLQFDGQTRISSTHYCNSYAELSLPQGLVPV